MTRDGSATHVLVGVDGQPAGWAALRQAADLARRLGAHLDVVHIFSLDEIETAGAVPPAFESPPTMVETPEMSETMARARADLQARIEDQLRGAGLDWVLHSRQGDPGRVLAELAAELDAYCVVVGTRGEGVKAFLQRLAEPSVSHAVIREHHRPVLVVGAPGSA